ncbi:Bax inhibitor-1/YccA family protein [Clostridium thermobutyricum]|uniref:Bax inhibitor 1 like protein n=1 Tax=Clostridium thermobutyricum DSM 4928 TaxID=1121339 RepID=A0A1V4SXR4_9CLOT|nr:Bax inhibitor-1/YccA family protein [Clostridium thermobutyricum]OPX48756.1 Bax inhibitor 1 like protein [Clostridium thermobutyricum DSM 4928]
MKIGRRTNPAMAKGFSEIVSDGTTMTISGTITKIVIFLAVLAVCFAYSWLNIPYSSGVMIGVSLVTFIVALITTFSPKICQFTGIIYAGLEGLFLGSLSKLFDRMFPGIVLPAVLLTFVCVLVTLAIYGKKPGIVDRTRKGVMIALITICITSLIGVVLSFFGVILPIYQNGPIGIIFSLAVVILATLCLMQDYDYILRAARSGAPKYMEWYGAFSLMVTLIWLYVEILNLLAQISNSRD